MRCYKELFCKNGLLYNIGFYLTSSIIMIHFATIIIFYLKDFKLIKNTIKEIKSKLKKDVKSEEKNKNKLNKKKKKRKRNDYIKKGDEIKNKNNDKKEVLNKKRKNIYNKKMKKKKGYKRLKDDSSIKNKTYKEEPPIKKIKRIKNINNNYMINVIQTNNISQNINEDLNEKSKRIIIQNAKGHNMKYTIYELNNLEYSEALKVDKRNYFQYYLSLLKSKYLLLFSFCNKNDYNSRIIKIFLFFYSFIIYYLVNTLFFKDSTMHKIYTDIGIYNFIYQLPQIIYSSLISSTLNLIVWL